jgi:hypothetical protein
VLNDKKITSFNGVQARKKRKDREILETEKELGEY